MTTLAPDVLEWLVGEWCEVIGSAQNSGIVNDSGDIGQTSKHWSRQDNPSGSWAVTHAKDKKGPSNMSAALDVSMSEADMKKVHGRFKTLYNNRATDPRAAYVDCFNGWDGNGSPGRYDLPAGNVSTTDDSHKWHEHVETFYQYTGIDAESWKAARAILSVVKGETPEQWLAAEGGGDDLVTTQAEFNAFMDSWVKTRYKAADDSPEATVRNYMRAWPGVYIGGPLPEGKNWLGTTTFIHDTVKALAEASPDISDEDMAAIEEAAYAGAVAGAADVDAIVAGVLNGLNTAGLSDEQQADVEAAVRSVFADAGTDAPTG